MSIDRRNFAIVALVPALLWLLCWPFGDVAVNDDFAFAYTVQKLMETGRIVFNGWSCPVLGPQAYWAAAVARGMGGFSHDAMRISVLPFAIVTALLTYGLHRRFAIGPAWSALATGWLVASSLHVPWAASFMTDVPGLTFWVAVLHAATSLGRAATARATALSAAALLVLAVLGGCVRQSTFALAGVAFAWELLRRWRAGDRPWLVLPFAVALAGATIAIMAWAARQPYYIGEGLPDHRRLLAGAVNLLALALDLGLHLLPLTLALCWAAGVRPSRRGVLVVGVIAIACVGATLAFGGASRWSSLARAPFQGGTLSATGLTAAGTDAPGERPTLFPLALRVALAIATYASLAWWAGASRYATALRSGDLGGALRMTVKAWRDADGTLRTFAIVSLAYVAMLFPRATHGWLFDRYLLVVMPIVSIAAIRAVAPRRSPPAVAWAAIAVVGLVAALATNDHFRELRARAAIVASLGESGIGRDRVVAGVSSDGWAQLQATGYLNDFRLPSPPYRAGANDRERRQLYLFLPRTPLITPEYLIESAPARPTGPIFESWSYDGLLPPGKRWLVVRRLPDPPEQWPDSDLGVVRTTRSP